jgi:hypothetical protein
MGPPQKLQRKQNSSKNGWSAPDAPYRPEWMRLNVVQQFSMLLILVPSVIANSALWFTTSRERRNGSHTDVVGDFLQSVGYYL